MYKVEIPLKLPSLNEYINACRSNKHAGAEFKKRAEYDIHWFIKTLPHIEKPVKIKFTWHERNAKRDLDNICFAKKFILDCMVKCGVLDNDTRKEVTGFEDIFPPVGQDWKVILEIKEVN